MLFMGIDIGTQGVRSVISDKGGKLVASASRAFSVMNSSATEGYYEQEAEVWWEAARNVIDGCVNQLKNHGFNAGDITAISIDGTSGTVVPLDREYTPLSNALMYNDMRSKTEAARIHEAGSGLEAKLGFKFNASFALPKILWIKNNKPDVYEQTEVFAHQADYIVGKLCGEYCISDYSNALKTGYDLVDDCWPELLRFLDLDDEKFPKVIAPGNIIGYITKEAAKGLGLSTKTVVVAGATDGYASALAAGAVKVDDWASIIGTTLVLKGVTAELLIDPTGSSYSHKLPSGAWMIGGASNMGGRCLNDSFEKSRFAELDKAVPGLIPTGVLSYPLHGKGERFPFLDPNAEAFFIGDISDPRAHYTALLEGVAYAERLAFEMMIKFGCKVGDVIYTTGGACRSDEWLAIRATILNRQMKVPKVVDAAMGCVMLAASKTYYEFLEEASEHMITFEKVIDPISELVASYEELYQKAYQEFKMRFRIGG